jgi:hypothetical protein
MSMIRIYVAHAECFLHIDIRILYTTFTITKPAFVLAAQRVNDA